MDAPQGGQRQGALSLELASEPAFDWRGLMDGVAIAVCGAHLEGLPLNAQLLERGARLLARTRTAPAYRLYALPGGPPHRPGLMRVEEQGAACASRYRGAAEKPLHESATSISRNRCQAMPLRPAT